jgi:hypothetical protein
MRRARFQPTLRRICKFQVKKRVKDESSFGTRIIASLGVHSSSPTIYNDERVQLRQSKVLERDDVAKEYKKEAKLTRKLLRLLSP